MYSQLFQSKNPSKQYSSYASRSEQELLESFLLSERGQHNSLFNNENFESDSDENEEKQNIKKINMGIERVQDIKDKISQKKEQIQRQKQMKQKQQQELLQSLKKQQEEKQENKNQDINNVSNNSLVIKSILQQDMGKQNEIQINQSQVYRNQQKEKQQILIKQDVSKNLEEKKIRSISCDNDQKQLKNILLQSDNKVNIAYMGYFFQQSDEKQIDDYDLYQDKKQKIASLSMLKNSKPKVINFQQKLGVENYSHIDDYYEQKIKGTEMHLVNRYKQILKEELDMQLGYTTFQEQQLQRYDSSSYLAFKYRQRHAAQRKKQIIVKEIINEEKEFINEKKKQEKQRVNKDLEEKNQISNKQSISKMKRKNISLQEQSQEEDHEDYQQLSRKERFQKKMDEYNAKIEREINNKNLKQQQQDDDDEQISQDNISIVQSNQKSEVSQQNVNNTVTTINQNKQPDKKTIVQEVSISPQRKRLSVMYTNLGRYVQEQDLKMEDKSIKLPSILNSHQKYQYQKQIDENLSPLKLKRKQKISNQSQNQYYNQLLKQSQTVSINCYSAGNDQNQGQFQKARFQSVSDKQNYNNNSINLNISEFQTTSELKVNNQNGRVLDQNYKKQYQIGDTPKSFILSPIHSNSREITFTNKNQDSNKNVYLNNEQQDQLDLKSLLKMQKPGKNEKRDFQMRSFTLDLQQMGNINQKNQEKNNITQKNRDQKQETSQVIYNNSNNYNNRSNLKYITNSRLKRSNVTSLQRDSKLQMAISEQSKRKKIRLGQFLKMDGKIDYDKLELNQIYDLFQQFVDQLKQMEKENQKMFDEQSQKYIGTFVTLFKNMMYKKIEQLNFELDICQGKDNLKFSSLGKNKSLSQNKQYKKSDQFFIIEQIKKINEKLKEIEEFEEYMRQCAELDQDIRQNNEGVSQLQDQFNNFCDNLEFFYNVLKEHEFPNKEIADIILKMKQAEYVDNKGVQEDILKEYKQSINDMQNPHNSLFQVRRERQKLIQSTIKKKKNRQASSFY